MATGSKSPFVSAAAKWRTPRSAQSCSSSLALTVLKLATVAKGAKLEGRNMSMFLSPKNSK